jgi:hypothetical protein
MFLRSSKRFVLPLVGFVRLDVSCSPLPLVHCERMATAFMHLEARLFVQSTPY